MGGITFKFDASHFDQSLEQTLHKLKTKGRGIILKAGHQMRHNVMEVIRLKGAVGSTGDLRKRIHVEQGERAGIITAVVKPGVNYAVFVHEGTRPHFPPLAPLETWVRRKLKKTGPEAEEIARRIQRHIGFHGTKPFPFFRIAEKKYRGEILKQIGKEVRQVIGS